MGICVPVSPMSWPACTPQLIRETYSPIHRRPLATASRPFKFPAVCACCSHCAWSIDRWNSKSPKDEIKIVTIQISASYCSDTLVVIFCKDIDLFTEKRSILLLQAPHSKVHGANMRPIGDRQSPGGPHVDPMNFVIWVGIQYRLPVDAPVIWSAHVHTSHAEPYPCTFSNTVSLLKFGFEKYFLGDLAVYKNIWYH